MNKNKLCNCAKNSYATFYIITSLQHVNYWGNKLASRLRRSSSAAFTTISLCINGIYQQTINKLLSN